MGFEQQPGAHAGLLQTLWGVWLGCIRAAAVDGLVACLLSLPACPSACQPARPPAQLVCPPVCPSVECIPVTPHLLLARPFKCDPFQPWAAPSIPLVKTGSALSLIVCVLYCFVCRLCCGGRGADHQGPPAARVHSGGACRGRPPVPHRPRPQGRCGRVLIFVCRDEYQHNECMRPPPHLPQA